MREMAADDWVREVNALRAVEDPMERRLGFCAVLTEALGGDLPPVIVGGHAVEFYSLGRYATSDVDLIVEHKGPIEELLRAWGFTPTGRSWWRADIDVQVDLIAVQVLRSEAYVRRVRVRGRTAYIVRVEEVVVDRLAACVHWQIPEDCEWAAQVTRMNRERVDWTYLERRAEEEGVTQALADLRQRLEATDGDD